MGKEVEHQTMICQFIHIGLTPFMVAGDELMSLFILFP
jgi:hypothetical protein